MRSRPATSPRRLALALLAAPALLLAACSGSAPEPAAPGAGILGWRLTLPSEGKSGNAATVDPAVLSPPYLTRGAQGQLVFWAPVEGATTRNSDHARTELSSNDNFTAGTGPQELRASVSVAQLPPESQDVIIGQIHGAGDLISVPFVMLHYTAGTVHAVVKQQRSGDAATKLELLTGVPLGARFDFALRDEGTGALQISATYAGQQATRDTPLPAAFRDATVRFQAGAYQQDSETDAGPDAGARVEFATLSAGTRTAAPLPDPS